MKVLYVSSNGGIHDYRFLKKLVNDYEVLFLHYAAGEIIDEIDKLDNLQIISKKPAFRSMPLISERTHFKNVVKEFKPDIIHTGYVWQVGILAAASGFHPHLSMPWGSDILTEPDKSLFRRRLVRKVMHTCDHVQCDAEFVKKKIIDDYSLPKEKITVFPWGIDLEQFTRSNKASARSSLKLDKDKFIVLYNRYFEPVYGVNYLLDAYREFAAGKDDVMMLMLSDGSGKNDVLKYITEKGLDEKIQLIGRVPNHELPAFLSAADVYVSPSLSDGTSLSLLEAMACGTGMIVTDVPAIMEWVNADNGLIVKKGNTVEIKKALEEYYINRDLAATHGLKNIQIAKERADWDKNYLKLKEIYNKLVKQAP
jgi:glycosyltransferase involved in cell wall biosynthesis